MPRKRAAAHAGDSVSRPAGGEGREQLLRGVLWERLACERLEEGGARVWSTALIAFAAAAAAHIGYQVDTMAQGASA